jgi:thiamine biosynthesis lipoprotein
MATDIAVRACGDDTRQLQSAVERALAVFHDVETQCTRFDPASPLMAANAAADDWVEVPERCFDALVEAAAAYRRTGGRFDPRVHDDLRRLGYVTSLAFESGGVDLEGTPVARRPARPSWEPKFDAADSLVNLGGQPVDLGGIGKGLAVRWASEALRADTGDFLVEAGGDCYAAGHRPGDDWRIGVEDPLGGTDPLLVLQVCDRAVTTSSIRIRRWTVGERPVHHLIDPATGLPGGEGLLAVTVVGADPADAEVDAKTLFLEDRLHIADTARADDIAACWVTDDGQVGVSPAMAPYIVWQRA